MSISNRRRFLTLALGAGASLGGWGLCAWRRRPGSGAEPAAEGAPPLPDEDLQAVAQKTWALGADVSLTVLHSRREVAERAVAAAVAELRLVERLMSLYRPESALCRLNRDCVLDRPHPYLVEVLRAAEATSRQTAGAFDVTVQPLWNAYAAAQKAGQLPDAKAVEAARRNVDWRQVETAADRVRLRGADTAVTLNGIAQGFAADRVLAALRQHDIRHALVNTGEIATLGGKARDEAWTVGIQHPRRDEAYLALAKLQGRCLATSGDYATAFSSDRRDHHVFDPHTGHSPQELAGVSVAAATATQADALSTALFVLGPQRGRELVEATPAADALFVLKDGTTLTTSGFPASA
jgi:thiamine biosynthesis lipoprotein